MKTLTLNLAHALITLATFVFAAAPASGQGMGREPPPAADSAPIRLPLPQQDGPISVEAVLATRRSVRTFTNKAVSLQELSQLLWAAQGITHPHRYRTAPSAGALYPPWRSWSRQAW